MVNIREKKLFNRIHDEGVHVNKTIGRLLRIILLEKDVIKKQKKCNGKFSFSSIHCRFFLTYCHTRAVVKTT